MNFVSGNTLAEVASLMGDAARANIVSALMGGRALTAGELAYHARVTPQTTSAHLAKLAEARLVTVEKQGRHRYFRLASPEVAHAVEALMSLAAAGPQRHRPVGPGTRRCAPPAPATTIWRGASARASPMRFAATVTSSWAVRGTGRRR
jgi:DNA-binding transcriptional ArsR family regulator